MESNIHLQFEHLVKKEDLNTTYSFLKGLDKDQKRALVKTIIKVDKYYSEFLQHGNRWSSRGSGQQHTLISCAKFVCMNKKEFIRHGSSWLDKDYIKKIMAFYTPSWFGAYVNERLTDWGAPFRMDYEWMMELKGQGVLEPSTELILRLLPPYIYEEEKNVPPQMVTINGKKVKQNRVLWYCDPQKLQKYPESLKEHIWLIFQDESSIHWVDHYKNFSEKRERLYNWKDVFKKISQDAWIDRKRVLKSCLAAMNLNFNRSLCGWFVDLFLELEPRQEELLRLQSDLMASFNSPHSKAINESLKLLKVLCTEDKFRTKEFLDYVPQLLSSETKTTVNRSLMILDKLARKSPRRRKAITTLAIQALIHEDAGIQKRVAKLLQKYGQPKDKTLCEELEAYRELLFATSEEILEDFLAPQELKEAIELSHQPIPLNPLESEAEVRMPESIDDLIYLASQAFDNHHPLHFELLPAALMAFNKKLGPDELDRLGPALQRAYKLIMGDWRSGMGLLDHMLACFFASYIDEKLKSLAGACKSLRKIKESFAKNDLNWALEYKHYQQRIFPFMSWLKGNDRIYRPYFLKLQDVLRFLKKDIELPLLSTPSHGNYWLHPKVLVDRVATWQEEGVQMSHVDLQLAMSRVYLPGAKAYIGEVQVKLREEEKELLCFLFDREAMPSKEIKTISHWWMAGITKTPQKVYEAFSNFSFAEIPLHHYNGQFPWKYYLKEHKSNIYNYSSRKYEKQIRIAKWLDIDISKHESGILENITSFFSPIRKPGSKETCLIYDDLYLRNLRWSVMRGA
ncbi:MAG: DUF6493 family protein, partial [Bacteroidota bacterium]